MNEPTTNAKWNLHNMELLDNVDKLHNFFGESPKRRIKNTLQMMCNKKREQEAFDLFKFLNTAKKRGTVLGPCMVLERLNYVMGDDERPMSEATPDERAKLRAMEAFPLRTPGRIMPQAASELWTRNDAQFKGHASRTLYRLYYVCYRASKIPDVDAQKLAHQASKPPAIAPIAAPANVKFQAERKKRTNLSLDDDQAADMLLVVQQGQFGLDASDLVQARTIKTLEVLNGSRPLHARMCPIIGIDWQDEKVKVYEPRPNRPVADDGRLSFKGASETFRQQLSIHPTLLKPVQGESNPGPPPMVLFSPKAAKLGYYAPMGMDEYTTLSRAPADALGIKGYTPYQHRRTFASAKGADLDSLDSISLGLGHTGDKVVSRYLDFSKPKRAHRAGQKVEYLLALKRQNLMAGAT